MVIGESPDLVMIKLYPPVACDTAFQLATNEVAVTEVAGVAV